MYFSMYVRMHVCNCVHACMYACMYVELVISEKYCITLSFVTLAGALKGKGVSAQKRRTSVILVILKAFLGSASSHIYIRTYIHEYILYIHTYIHTYIHRVYRT